ncbi:hypothetical protein NMG60_11001450 [Bertholletia excelsa]
MASSFRQWESDPLFSAAEVVQDSADRLESLFRLILHEQSLIQEDHPDAKLLKSIEYHRRDLATTLGTTKWQLEDFEREVNCSGAMDKSHVRENMILRYKQFVMAIREQILNVESQLGDTSEGISLRSSQWVNLDEQDRNGLALFLSGENPSEHATSHDLEDSNIMKRFLDPITASSLNDEIIEQNPGEVEKLHMNGFECLDHNYSLTEDKLMKSRSNYSTQRSYEAKPSLGEVKRVHEGESWDLEADGATKKNLFHNNRLRGYYGRMNIFGPLHNLFFAYRSRGGRSFIKRWKDGEEQIHSPVYTKITHTAQSSSRQMNLASGYSRFQGLFSELFALVRYSCCWLGECRARYHSSSDFFGRYLGIPLWSCMSCFLVMHISCLNYSSLICAEVFFCLQVEIMSLWSWVPDP